MEKKLVILLAFVMLVTPAFAVDVIITTNATYPDIAVAQQVASFIGAYVFTVDPNSITPETLSEIQSINPEHIYIFGGPVVVSEQIEKELKIRFGEENVTRIYGYTKFGTSAKVFRHFFLGNCSEIILVGDNYDDAWEKVNAKPAKDLVLKAAEYSIAKGIPMILIPKDELPAEIEEIISLCKPDKIILLGNLTAVKEKVKNITKNIEEEIGDEKSKAKEIESKALNHSKVLVIAAVGSFKDEIETKKVPKGASILVRSENEIPNVIERVKNIVSQNPQIKKVLVVGRPELAKKIYSNLTAAGISNVTCPVCKGEEISKEIRKEVEEINKRYLVEVKPKVIAKLYKIAKNLTIICKDLIARLPEDVNASKVQILKDICEKQTIEKIQEAITKLEDLALREKIKLKWEKVKRSEEAEIEEIEKETKSKEKAKEIEKKFLEDVVKMLKEKCEKLSELETEAREVIKKVCEKKEECVEILSELKKAIDENNIEKIVELREEFREKCTSLWEIRSSFIIGRAKVIPQPQPISPVEKIGTAEREVSSSI